MAAALGSHEGEKKRTSSDADLVEKCKKIKRPKSLVKINEKRLLVVQKENPSRKLRKKIGWACIHGNLGIVRTSPPDERV